VEGVGETTVPVCVIHFDNEDHTVLGGMKEARTQLRAMRQLWRKEHVTDLQRERIIKSLLSGLKRRCDAFADKFGEQFPELSRAYQSLHDAMLEKLI
jgi:hypothetical protein